MSKIKANMKKSRIEFLKRIESGEIGKISSLKGLADYRIGVVAVEDVDWKEDNKVWKLEANRSYPRELFCSKCKRKVLMSNEMFRMYQENPIPSGISCGRCIEKEFNLKKDGRTIAWEGNTLSSGTGEIDIENFK